MMEMRMVTLVTFEILLLLQQRLLLLLGLWMLQLELLGMFLL